MVVGATAGLVDAGSLEADAVAELVGAGSALGAASDFVAASAAGLLDVAA